MLNQTFTGVPFPAHLLPLPSWQAVRPTFICPGGRELAITLPGIGPKMPVWADSEIARFREQQRLEEESVQMALFGPAAMASHEAIIKRMEQDMAPVLKLFEEGRDEEAIVLWEGQ